MKSLIFITDYGSDALATSEALEGIKRSAGAPFFVHLVTSRPFNTIHTAFLLAQINRALGKEQAKETIFFLNTDPRIHTQEAVQAAQGSPLVAALLHNQALVFSPNAGFCLSLVKEEIQKLYKVNIAADGSQFRSRDIFAGVIGQALKGDSSPLFGADLPLQTTIPVLPEGIFVLHCDNYGNIKLFLQKNTLEKQGIHQGDEVTVTIGDKTISGIRVAPTIFTVPPGTLVLAPGSSGPRENSYFELSLRFNGDAKRSVASIFGWPEPGTRVSLLKK